MIDLTCMDDVSQISLDELSQAVIEPQYSGYFLGAPGSEHYRLLAYISTLYDHKTLLDVGTYKGCSALAMSYNTTNKVLSFDIHEGLRRLHYAPDNVEFIVDNILNESYKQIILDSPFILLDTDHDGHFENAFYRHLQTIGYKGILMLDDISLNDAMKVFWNGITEQKVDLTLIGHWSGTGVVYFKD